MKSKTSGEKREKVGRTGGPWEQADEMAGGDARSAKADLDSDDDDLDETEARRTDDGRWDVFILDEDDSDPLPDYGDFWFPD